MMGVVDMAMGMFQHCMVVFVGMAFGKMKPRPDGHEQTGH